MGFVVKVVLLTTWGDLHYIGLNGLEIYDGKGEPLLFSGRKEFKLVAEPNSVISLNLMKKKIYLCKRSMS
jgi:hypothetical protein